MISSTLNLPGDFTDLTTVCSAGLLHFKLGAHLLDLRGLRLSGQAAHLGHQRGIGHSHLDARREHAEFVTQQATRVAARSSGRWPRSPLSTREPLRGTGAHDVAWIPQNRATASPFEFLTKLIG